MGSDLSDSLIEHPDGLGIRRPWGWALSRATRAWPWNRWPACTHSASRFMPEAEREALLQRLTLTRYTDAITTRDVLREAPQTIRKNGYALDRGGRTDLQPLEPSRGRHLDQWPIVSLSRRTGPRR